jgi:hypothetical protein
MFEALQRCTYSNSQSQRGSNPCLHLERAERIVASEFIRSQEMPFQQVKSPNLADR